MRKWKLLLISIIISCFFIPQVAHGAVSAVLSLQPSSSNYKIGDIFNVEIKLDTGGNATAGVDVHYLNYNANLLEARMVTAGTLYANTNTNNIANGKIDFSQTSAGGTTYNGQGTLATISFKALAAGAANITFDFTHGSTTDTNVASAGQDVLASATGASFTIQTAAVPDTTPPAAIALQLANDPNNPETAVILTWIAPADDGNNSSSGPATSYDIRYSTAEITADNFASANLAQGIPVPSAPGAAEIFTIVGLSRQTKYYFAAKAADEGPRWSALSNVPFIETLDKTAPKKIDNLSVDVLNTTTNKIKLTWTAPGDDVAIGTATNYDLRYSIANITDANFNSATQATGITAPKIAGSTEMFEISGLLSNTKYYFAIKTVDDKSNWSILSNIASETTKTAPPPPDTTPPSQITNLTVSNRTSNSVILTWTAPGDDGSVGQASSYDIRYSTANIANDAAFNAATQATGLDAFTPKPAGGTETFTISNLSDIKYYFAIKTADEAANWSLLFSNVAIAEDKTAPSSKGGTDVGSLKASEIKSTSVKLTWTASGDDGDTGTAAQYDLRYSTAQITTANWANAVQAQNEPAPQIAGSTEILEVTGLLPATTYYFALQIADEAGNKSDLGKNLSITTIAAEPPADTTAPAKITNLSSSAQTTNSVTLTWTAPGDDGAIGQAASYDIRYATSNMTDANFAQAAAASGLSNFKPKIAKEAESFIVTGLSAGAKYYFAIKTSDEVPNVSEMSNVISFTTLTVALPPPPPPPGGPGGTPPPSDTTPPSKPTEFKAVGSETQISLSWQNPKDSDFVRVKILRDDKVIYEGNKESYIDANLVNNQTYTYSITACDGVPNWSEKAVLKASPKQGQIVIKSEPLTRQQLIAQIKAKIQEIQLKILELRRQLLVILIENIKAKIAILKSNE